MYAVVRTGGKQYSVREGQQLDVEKLAGVEGDRIELTDVLLIGDGDNLTVGSPTVPGARGVTEVLGQNRAKKVTIFKYKRKTRYKRKIGHRQPFTRLAVREFASVTPLSRPELPRPQPYRGHPRSARLDEHRPCDVVRGAAPEAAGDEAVDRVEVALEQRREPFGIGE